MSMQTRLTGIIEYEGRSKDYDQNSDAAGQNLQPGKVVKGKILSVTRSDHEHTPPVADPSIYRSILVRIDNMCFGNADHYDAEFLVTPEQWEDRLIGRDVFVVVGELVDVEGGSTWARYAQNIMLYWAVEVKPGDEIIGRPQEIAVIEGENGEKLQAFRLHFLEAEAIDVYHDFYVPTRLWNSDFLKGNVKVVVGRGVNDDDKCNHFVDSIMPVI